MTEPEGDCTNIEIDNTKEKILKELAALKDSIRKIESSCNESISFLGIKSDAIGQELCDFKQSNNSTNYQIGTLVGEIEKSKKDIMEIREMILHIDYWLSNSGIKEESKNSNIQNLKKENEKLRQENLLNTENKFHENAFRMVIDELVKDNVGLKKKIERLTNLSEVNIDLQKEIDNCIKEIEELKKRNEELTIENQLISISNIEDFELSKTKLHFCGIEGFNEMLNNIQKGNVIKAKDVENRLKEENLKLKKVFGEISRMLDDCL
jgi:hypothetical protein